ncbi:DsbA family oxidoreductase [Polynucleobacter sp. IMCC30063]|uniref:DsbA family oxidoreductase n=1 Tax=unclassified Polynucleobacter TaxID=2640945 RepID=UPI001F288837|nr:MULTISPECIES: DsbA family oxidoreductase [unclassified Polynucleobacter]MCE7506698.1 DsbA family oxidoreductase [Polynucleobacter sp. IMCC30063]MCE7529895.1 DsbA family oxidoreductase [Polynucleobacter sp. IMCC 29146]
MKPKIKIDVVSDVACPWCAVGYGELNKAIEAMADEADFEIHFQPFELNPHMPAGGQDAVEHLTQKYGLSPEQVQVNQARIRARAAAVGFDFHPAGRKRIYNTFNAHRLLYWAAKECGLPAQAALKKELLNTYFCLAVSMDDVDNVLAAVGRAGLDQARAKAVLESDEFSQEVQSQKQTFQNLGIHGVPAFILNDQHLIEGAQSSAVLLNSFKQLLEA